MLHFNEASSALKQQRASEEQASPYKILVLDAFSKMVIAPLVSVQDLRQKGGVTLHLAIDTPREPIPDVPAVYFVRATAENVEHILQVQHLSKPASRSTAAIVMAPVNCMLHCRTQKPGCMTRSMSTSPLSFRGSCWTPWQKVLQMAT